MAVCFSCVRKVDWLWGWGCRRGRLCLCRRLYVVTAAAVMVGALLYFISCFPASYWRPRDQKYQGVFRPGNVTYLRVKGFLIDQHRILYNELNEQEEKIKKSADPSIYKERLKRVRQVCDSPHRKPTSFSMTDFLSQSWFVERHKLIYCEVPKVGCTFWKRTLEVLRRNDPRLKTPYELLYEECAHGKEQAIESITREVSKGFSQTEIISKRYTKFMFTREPFARLFSAYIDKYFFPNNFFWKYGKDIIFPRRGVKYFKGRQPGHDVSFAEFIQEILSRENRYLDDHFKPAHLICDMCNVQFDVLGTMETFKEDAFHILNTINASNEITFKTFQRESTIDSVVDMIGKVFQYRKTVEIFLDFEHILRRAWRRLKISNVLYSKEPFPFTKEEIPSMQMEHFTGVVIDLYKRSVNIKRNNKKVAFLQAYRQLSDKTLNDLREKYRLDFEMFGYDITGPHLDQIEQSLTADDLAYDYYDIIRLY